MTESVTIQIGTVVKDRWFILSHAATLLFGKLYRAQDQFAEQEHFLFILDPDHNDAFEDVTDEDYHIPPGRLRQVPGYLEIEDKGFWKGHYYVACPYFEAKNLRKKFDEQGVFLLPQAARILVEITNTIMIIEDLGYTVPYLWEEAILLGNNGDVAILPWEMWPPIQLLDTDEVVTVHLYASYEMVTAFTPSRQNASAILGMLLFHLLTGNFPFKGATYGDVFHNMKNLKRKRLQEFDTTMPPALDDFCARCFDIDPWRRPATAANLCIDLADLCDSLDKYMDKHIVDPESKFIFQEYLRRSRIEDDETSAILNSDLDPLAVTSEGKTEVLRELGDRIFLFASLSAFFIAIVFFFLFIYGS